VERLDRRASAAADDARAAWSPVEDPDAGALPGPAQRLPVQVDGDAAGGAGRAHDEAVARTRRLRDRIVLEDEVARDDVAAFARHVLALYVVPAELRARRDATHEGQEKR
jgi:hypothetical protein